MEASILEAQEAIRRLRSHRDSGRVEAVLRSELNSRFRSIFPSPTDQWWINHHTLGAEAHTKVGRQSGASVSRFIDNLVGATTIEYEADLRNPAKRALGLQQVKEHLGGLIRSGADPSQIRGVLSDTVEWYAYEAVVLPDVRPRFCTSEDVELSLIDQLRLRDASEMAATRLIAFLRRHLAREQSRVLRAEHLALDVGLGTESHIHTANGLSQLVDQARVVDPSVALATELWSSFVDHLESGTDDFRCTTYVDEVYLVILARLLSANVLSGQGRLSDDDELARILDGAFFRDVFQLENMVERDYFGWLTQHPHRASVVSLARPLQRDLFAYDYRSTGQEDVFGRLLAQLASRSQRQLLGQEPTPTWLAKKLADHCIARLRADEAPRLVDVCCGSGTIVAEALKAAREKMGLEGMSELRDVITGFDIDPLAVCLAKTTWVITLASEIKVATTAIDIPIYHADSLFAATPVSQVLPLLAEDQGIEVTLDGVAISLPPPLVQPENAEIFDRIVDWGLSEARDAQATGRVPTLSQEDVAIFLEGASTAAESNVTDPVLQRELVPAVRELVQRMIELAVAGRNGIWAFVLRNTYRPALLAGQFSGLVSNPPWLTLSALADNPYRDMLKARAIAYNVRPVGESALHLELATIHLLHAVDRYLSVGASVACLLPRSIMNGKHQERFRKHGFLDSQRAVPLRIAGVWDVEGGTFKIPSVALVGEKCESVTQCGVTPTGGIVGQAGFVARDLVVAPEGYGRTAWMIEDPGMDPVQPIKKTISRVPQQGADLMPRTAVCVEALNGDEVECRVATPTETTPWGFTVRKSKKLVEASFPGHVAPCFIHRMAQSENLLPFLLGRHRAPIAIPARRKGSGEWEILEDVEIRRLGFGHTSRRFETINAALKDLNSDRLQRGINMRSKLVKQKFSGKGYVLLSGAGGKRICAAAIGVDEAKGLVIDQTLYWTEIEDVAETWYWVGVFNSQAMTDAVLPLNPRGDFGPRHIHTLPYSRIPEFDGEDERHKRISDLARVVEAKVKNIVANDAYLDDPARSLPHRRRRLHAKLASTREMRTIEKLCTLLLKASEAD